MRKKTREEYVNEVKEINSNIEIAGEYVNSHTKIKFRCLLDGYEWETNPSNILRGHGCPKCSNNAHKTHEEYVAEVKKLNPDIAIIGKYVNAHTKIKHKCLIDGYEWDSAPNSILSRYGCPMCGRNAPKTMEIYKEELKKKNPNIEAIGLYNGANFPITHKCLIDNYIWEAHPAQILSGTGCPECGKIKYANATRKTLEKYKAELLIINPNIEVISEYQNANTPILHKCSLDGYEWLVSPSNILQGSGCPKCNESRGEKQICKWLTKHNIIFQQQFRFKNCKDVCPLPFDFYLPGYNTCIEFNREQHQRPIDYFGGEKRYEILMRHDQIKNQYCKDNNIKLLRINNIQDIDNKLNNFLLA